MTPGANWILVVDDDELQREVIRAQLASIGWSTVHLAAGGEEALTCFDAHADQIVAVISDLSMPSMDGPVFMRHLAQRQCRAGIVLLSGVQDEILHSAAGLASAHGLSILGVLAKPTSSVHLGELLARVRPPDAHTRIEAAELSRERLAAALALGEIVPWYQPKLDIRSGRLVGAEALARWPTAHGMISPGRFVPAMEAAGLADELLFSMARQVASDVAQWRHQGLRFPAAINMSMDNAQNLQLPEKLLQVVSDAGLRPTDFIIEITESRLMTERSVAMETLTRLSLMGFTLSIDDFGTGYSSLVQLVDLPFRELKIDASFVQRASTERKARTILRISLLIGANLQMSVIAEGVETAEQLEFLRECGGAIVQGYHIARPMPFADWQQMDLTRFAKAGSKLPATVNAPLPAVAGFDVAAALARIDGDTDQYLNFLRLFRDRNTDRISAIRSALTCGDVQAARVLTHTLKGSAGSIGAVKLQAAAEQFEKSLRERGVRAELFAALEAEWRQAMVSMEILFG